MLAVPVDDSMVYAELNKSGVCLGMTGVGRQGVQTAKQQMLHGSFVVKRTVFSFNIFSLIPSLASNHWQIQSRKSHTFVYEMSALSLPSPRTYFILAVPGSLKFLDVP